MLGVLQLRRRSPAGGVRCRLRRCERPRRATPVRPREGQCARLHPEDGHPCRAAGHQPRRLAAARCATLRAEVGWLLAGRPAAGRVIMSKRPLADGPSKREIPLARDSPLLVRLALFAQSIRVIIRRSAGRARAARAGGGGLCRRGGARDAQRRPGSAALRCAAEPIAVVEAMASL